MNDSVREKLQEMIEQYGRSLCDEPKRCESLLRDFCGKDRRKINLLIAALNQGIATDLLNSSNSISQQLVSARLVKRLQDNLGTAEEFAIWAVDSWAIALLPKESVSHKQDRISYKQRDYIDKNIIRPSGLLSYRLLYFYWICDCSSSMSHDGKIQTLNFAIREVIPCLRETSVEMPHAQILVRALKFSSGAQWQVAEPTPIEDFEWTDLTTTADDSSNLGKALSMVAEQLKIPPMPNRALPPVLVLITDGRPTDDYQRGLNELLNEPWGKKAVRIAIPIGNDTDEEVLQKFIAHPELKPLKAKNLDQLVRLIRLYSTMPTLDIDDNNKNSNMDGDDMWW